jgi:rhodanese-related sulfurtransferase
MMNNVDAQTAARWLDAGEAVLIDVREPDEFAREHIPQAWSVPLSQVAVALPHVPPGRKRVFQCQKGKRGEQACALVTGEAWNIEGGIEAWAAAGLAVVGNRAGAPRIPLMRQVQVVVGLLLLGCVALGFSGVAAGFVLAGVFAAALVFAGLTGWCGMAMLLAKMPWNNPAKSTAPRSCCG